MSKIKRIVLDLCLVTALLFCCVENITANGGPTDGSTIIATGDIRLTPKKLISLEEELIHIQLDGDFAEVFVYYKFKNNGPEEKVEYAFPVNYYGATDFYGEGWQNECLPWFRIADETGELDLSERVVSVNVTDEDEEYRKPAKKWFITKIVFPQNKEKIITVRYRVKNYLDDFGTNKAFFSERSDRIFTYILSPSGNWGNGKVEKFKVIIDAGNNIKQGSFIKSIRPFSFVNYGGIYIYEDNDLNLIDAKSLQVTYDNTAYWMNQDFLNFRIKKNMVNLKASSTLKGYDVTNLLDGDPDTAWAEGVSGNGVGEWI